MNSTFSRYIHDRHATFKYGKGITERSGKEFHVFHEFIYFMGGNAELITESQHIQLQPHTLVLIPKETYHQMVITSDLGSYHRCLLQFSELPEDVPSKILEGVRLYSCDEELQYLFSKLMKAAWVEDRQGAVLLRSVLPLLMISLEEKKQLSSKNTFHVELIRQATEYINQNLHRKLPIEEVASVCNISESGLSHIFKKEMNISVHRFILQKRLVLAHHKITGGTGATAAALECGFEDYSGFYKQYKKTFGFSPSKK